MIDFGYPEWFKTFALKFADDHQLTTDEIADLRLRLHKFESDDPLVSIVIPAWNEEENICKTIASLAFNEFDFQCELIVVNNNSTDNTQAILNDLGVKTLFEPNQGIAPARRRGLLEARGKYHLCCDSDTIYPPTWIKTMTGILQSRENDGVACIYASYSFIPSGQRNRFALAVYETASSMIRSFKPGKTEPQRVLGFNFGFIRAVALAVNGFIMENPRKFRNEIGSEGFVGRSEDGVMAASIKRAGYKLLFVNDIKCRVWTSDRRLVIDGGLMHSIIQRLVKLFNRRIFNKIWNS
jgi:glycosyltransferase involved in cell wall biosynthesis